MSATRDWDAATYDRLSTDIQLVWAREQLARTSLRGDEVVVDAGCGSGRVTALLAELVPSGRVYGVDVAPSMAAHAREALGGRATILCQDLVDLALPEPVDLVFSNATFHWIPDHDALFAALHRALKPGGRLVAQCGGRGNIDAFRLTADEVAAEPPFREYFAGWRAPWNYATAEESAARLERAGFTDVRCWLEPKSVQPTDPRSFVQTVCLVRHLDPLPEALRAQFIDAVLERARRPAARSASGLAESARADVVQLPLVLDYVRLNLTAVRG